MTHYHNLVCPYAFLKLTSPPHKLSMNAERVIPNFYILGHTLTSRIWTHTWRLHFIHRYSAIFSVCFQHPVIIESNICLYCFLYLMGSLLCLFAHSCLTLHDPMVCSLPGSSVHGDSPGKNTREGCHVLLQGIFPTQGLNPGLQHCKQITIWATREISLSMSYHSCYLATRTHLYKSLHRVLSSTSHLP